jgi:hypothetical protein
MKLAPHLSVVWMLSIQWTVSTPSIQLRGMVLRHKGNVLSVSTHPSCAKAKNTLNYIIIPLSSSADHRGRALRSLEHWDRGFESHSRHGCLCAFILFVLSCIGSGLATGWSPVQGVLLTVLKLRNWSETKRFTDALCSKVGATRNRKRERERSSSSGA